MSDTALGTAQVSPAESATVGRILILVAAVLWSTSGAFVKSIDLPPVLIAMYRAFAAGGVLLVASLLMGTRWTWAPAMFGMVAFFALMNYSFITATASTTAANAILLQYTAPLWMLAASVLWLKEPLQIRSLIAILGSLLGIAVLIGGQPAGGAENTAGIYWGLVSGAAYAGVAVFMRLLRGHDALWLATVNHLATGLALLALIGTESFTTGSTQAFTAPPPATLAVLAVFGAAQMALPYVLFGKGLRTVSPQEAGIITLLEPILNPIWTYLKVGERPAPATLVGGAILVAMLGLRYVPAGRKPRQV